jgi:hypothetical protein
MSRRLGAALSLLVAVATFLPSCGGTPQTRIIRVDAGGTSIQDAVQRAQPGDIVEIGPGRYHEAVRVDRPNITIRGEDRNAVVLDGQDKLTNGFLVAANGVAIENLTIHGYVQNGIVFNGAEKVSRGKGVDPSKNYGAGSQVLDGYAARFITAYNNGLYGIYAFASRNGVIEDVYVSGHPDSGIYIGQCKPCNATVQRATAERNAIGYYGTNASGGVVVAQSVFRKNRLGIAPNSQKAERLAPQEDTVIVGNIVESNDDPLAPAIPQGFYGAGIAVGGGLRNLVTRNVVKENSFVGIVVLTLDAFTPEGNRIVGNLVTGNGTDLIYAPSGTSAADGNCFAGNSFSTSLPTGIESTMPCDGTSTLSSVPLLRTPIAPPGVDYRLLPAPIPQPTMPLSAMSARGGAAQWTPINIDDIPLPS